MSKELEIADNIKIEIGTINGITVRLINFTPRKKSPEELIDDAAELASMARFERDDPWQDPEFREKMHKEQMRWESEILKRSWGEE